MKRKSELIIIWGYMFDFLLTICEELSYKEVLDGIFPQYILDENIEKCIRTVKNLYNLSRTHWITVADHFRESTKMMRIRFAIILNDRIELYVA